MYRLLAPILIIVFACALAAPLPTPTTAPTATPRPWPTPTPFPTITPYPTAWPTPTPLPPDTGWQTLKSGLELRRIRLTTSEGDEQMTVIRVDPELWSLRVHYNPDEPKSVSAWAEILHTTVVVNGGYFTTENTASGLLISESAQWGTPYGSFAGMLAVTPSGNTTVRWLTDHPYDPAEPLAHAIQSFPMLVKPSGTLGFPADADDGSPARRTVVAQDIYGRILLIVAPLGKLSLHGLSLFLTNSDLEIHTALNLDGGTSTGLWLKTQEESVAVDSMVPVPSAISVSSR